MDPFFGGRANVARPGEEGLEITAGRRTGVVVEAHTTGSARKAQEALRASLEAGEPVMVYLDMGFLPYFDLPEGYHFGAHVVVVAGYDPASRTVLLADRDAALHPVDWDTLEQARGSKFRPFPPLHKWFTFDFSAARPPTPEETREAIVEVCRGMLEPPIANLGVKGIRKARAETLKWPKVLDPAALRRTCFNVAMFIDHRGGTGGGIFRYMYASFLGRGGGADGGAAPGCHGPRSGGYRGPMGAGGGGFHPRCRGRGPGGPARRGHGAAARDRRPGRGVLGESG